MNERQANLAKIKQYLEANPKDLMCILLWLKMKGYSINNPPPDKNVPTNP